MVFWETTTACNLACIHCRRLDVPRARSRDDLNTPQALHFIRSLPQTGNPVLIFSGGEPLIRPDLFDLAQEATRLALPIALATNGTIMDHALAQRVAHVGFHRVSISFDGPDPQTHDRFRGIQGAFQSSLRTFAILRQHGLSMQINTALARHNYTKLDQLYQLALHLGADALHVFMLVPVGCGMNLSQDIILTPDEYERALNWIYDRSLEARIQLKATCAPHYFRVMRQRGNPNTRPTPPSDHPHFNSMTKGCLAGQAVCFVSHSGEVFPCGYLPISSGNVKTAPQLLPLLHRLHILLPMASAFLHVLQRDIRRHLIGQLTHRRRNLLLVGQIVPQQSERRAGGPAG
jgi:MoaA/NifB/PqqE/SkfB family radical SAM enzyme